MYTGIAARAGAIFRPARIRLARRAIFFEGICLRCELNQRVALALAETETRRKGPEWIDLE